MNFEHEIFRLGTYAIMYHYNLQISKHIYPNEIKQWCLNQREIKICAKIATLNKCLNLMDSKLHSFIGIPNNTIDTTVNAIKVFVQE